MRKADVVAYYGTQERVAAALGLTRQAIVAWGPVIPQGQAYKLQALTKGQLKVIPELYQSRSERRA